MKVIGKERTDAPFYIVSRMPRRAAHEADMTAVSMKLRRQVPVGAGNFRDVAEYVSRMKRIVLGAQQERRPSNSRQEPDRTALLVIVCGITKAVHWRRELV